MTVNPRKPTLPIMLGKIALTLGVVDLLDSQRVTAQQVTDSLRRHCLGDWGNVDDHDKGVNDDAAKHGGQVLSVYAITPGKPAEGNNRLWVITDADRRTTTVLLPEEY